MKLSIVARVATHQDISYSHPLKMLQVLHYCVVLVVCKLSIGVELLTRELSDYPLAQCNDDTTAAYYHDVSTECWMRREGSGTLPTLYWITSR